MTFYEKIKSMSKEEMARLLWSMEAGNMNVPKLYVCDSLSIFDCRKRGCLNCYKEFLDCEVELLKHGGV